ncbi:MAG: GIY-YIG nuclease family protein [Desulfobacterales bacterium]
MENDYEEGCTRGAKKLWPVSPAFFILQHCAYILQSHTAGRYYRGQTDDIEKRLIQHNDPENTFTRTTSRLKGPWRLIHKIEA